MEHIHRYKLKDIAVCFNGFIAPKGYGRSIYMCEECGKMMMLGMKKLTDEEKLFMANRYKEKIENDRDIIRQEIVKDFEDLEKAFEKLVDNNLELEDKIAVLEKTLELACEDMCNLEFSICSYCRKSNQDCCLDRCPKDEKKTLIEYFKEQARKEIIKSEN